MLDIPLIKQEKGSNDCGEVSLLMLFKYYKIDISLEKIKKELNSDNRFTYAPELATFLLKNGFNVELIVLNPHIFSIFDIGLDIESILKKLKRLRFGKKFKKFHKVLDYYILFLNSGGQIKVKIPDKYDISFAIKNNYPVISLLTTNFLFSYNKSFNFHFNVITGLDKNNIYVNDSAAGKLKHNIDYYLYALSCSSYGDIDNGSLLIIKKK